MGGEAAGASVCVWLAGWLATRLFTLLLINFFLLLLRVAPGVVARTVHLVHTHAHEGGCMYVWLS